VLEGKNAENDYEHLLPHVCDAQAKRRGEHLVSIMHECTRACVCASVL
jgi:hypothetical protein